jgi:hypothetical protein
MYYQSIIQLSKLPIICIIILEIIKKINKMKHVKFNVNKINIGIKALF